MLNKQSLIVALISINAVTLAMEQSEQSNPMQQGTHINSNDTTVNAAHIFMQSTGQNTYHTHQQPTFTAQKTSDNPVFNAAGIVAKAAAEGAVQGIFQGAMQGVGSVLAQKIIAALNEPAEERDARQLLSKNQQIVNLSKLRDEVNNFCVETIHDDELAIMAHELRVGYGHALLSFIEKQRNEEICIITPLMHKVQDEVNAFAKDVNTIQDPSLIALCKEIQKSYGLLIYKQLVYEKESSKPAIVFPIH